MIKIEKYYPQEIYHFDNEGKLLGRLNELEHLDLLCQIAEQKINGCYLIFNDNKIEIQSDGTLENVVGLYDTQEKLISRLFKAQSKQI